MVIYGEYNPCPRCVARTRERVGTFGGTIVYTWPAGPKGGITFR
jgi:hypothetical protein